MGPSLEVLAFVSKGPTIFGGSPIVGSSSLLATARGLAVIGSGPIAGSDDPPTSVDNPAAVGGGLIANSSTLADWLIVVVWQLSAMLWRWWSNDR